MIVLSMALCTSVMAQRKKNVVKKPAPVTVTLTPEEMNYANLMPATAKIMFIDSIVVNEKDMLENVCISTTCGKINMTEKDSLQEYSCTNEMQTVRYSSLADSAGVHHLYVQQRIGRSWTAPSKIELEGGFSDIICPFLMPDGVTLYFSARGGEDRIGGHDIYYTVFNTDTRTFYRAQSIGLPYNSMDEDLYCIIDDDNKLGHLITKRHQPEGKVCIYVFVPTESRVTYDTESISTEQLASYAALNSIRDTQMDSEVLKNATARLTSLRNKQNEVTGESIHFILNEMITYHSLSDFKGNTNRERYEQLLTRKAELKQSEEALEILRTEFHEGNKEKSKQILEIEKFLQKERTEITRLEKQIRNAELMQK